MNQGDFKADLSLFWRKKLRETELKGARRKRGCKGVREKFLFI